MLNEEVRFSLFTALLPQFADGLNLRILFISITFLAESQNMWQDLQADSRQKDMEDRMVELQVLLSDEYQLLADKWMQYDLDKAELDRIKAKITAVNVKETDRLKLNVGGQRFEIRQTLTQNNKYFSSLQTSHDDLATADPDGFYYMDRDPKHVPLIMSYLRHGNVNLSNLSESQLAKIRREAEVFMVTDLITAIDAQKVRRRTGEGVSAVSFNLKKAPTDFFNGIFFEISVSRNVKLHSISFLAGERRKIVGEAYVKDGALDATAQFRKVGVVEQMVEQKGQLVCIPLQQPMTLPAGIHTVGVYSVSCPTAIGVVQRTSDGRTQGAVTLQRTFHTTNQKGYFSARAGEDQFDFCGELSIS